MRELKHIHVALAGNPNSGKTSIFNALTGARQHVGNYPGVTVEKREGHYTEEGRRFDVFDLPGTYSLTSYSPEERVAQDELLNTELDVVVVVVDSTQLKRSLVLLAQIIQTGANPVLCLNMADEAKKSGQKIDLQLFGSLLGFPVVETVGHKGIGVDGLKDAIRAEVASPASVSRLVLGERFERAFQKIKDKLTATDLSAKGLSWVAAKLLMGDDAFVNMVRNSGKAGELAIQEADTQRVKVEKETGMDISLFLMERYYGFVDGLLREVITSLPRGNARAISDRIDSIVVNRVLGIPIFLLVMYAIFWLTFSLGEYPMGWIETGFDALGGWIFKLWPDGSESPVRSLLVDGVIAGVGGVVVFLPNIALLFLGLALLEDTGYMPRAAFLVDRFMHRFGLHGRSFIPMMTGFGCSIPGIMATRVMENERDRLTTMLVLPLMSCGARFPIWMLLIPAFFAEEWRAPMLWTIYMVGITLALFLALLLRRTVLKGEEAPFVMELPPYRLPTVRAVAMKMVERSGIYLRKAGTVILGISVLMWIITSYPKLDSYQIDSEIAAGRISVGEKKIAGVETITPNEVEKRRKSEELANSIAGGMGRAMEPIIKPLGFDWKIGTAIVGAFAAKEVFVAQMGIIYSMEETGEEFESLRCGLRRDYSSLTGFSLMLFLLISAPCMATIAVTRRESGGWKWALVQFGGLTIIAYVISFLFFQIGRFFM
jgi:ferrous iron transport protein B